MKTNTIKIAIGIVSLAITMNAWCQNNNKPTIAILNVDAKGPSYEPNQLGNLTRIELEKLDVFNVMDQYDVNYSIDQNKLSTQNCYGKLCLVEIGKAIKVEKMYTGSVEVYGESILITMRLIDVKNEAVEKTFVKEFLNFPLEVQSMIEITVREMFGLTNDKTKESRLTKPYNYENSINNPDVPKLNLSGPRMGFGIFTGPTASRLGESRTKGGYEAIPLMFQFGYQFEKQYLNEGNFQALFEFLPLVTGLDQGLFIPSFTFMNGLRDNRKGWEFAFGPTFSLVEKAEGYYDSKGEWHLKNEWREVNANNDLIKNPNPIIERLDSRGNVVLSTGFIFAFGRTFKSGKLNIPVNAYVIPNKDGIRLGASFGFNAKK